MTDSIGAAARTIRDIQTHGFDAIWRASALDACRQERRFYMTLDNGVWAVILVGAVIQMVLAWEKTTRLDLVRQLGRELAARRDAGG
jgi:hypothetical protein